MVLFKKMKKKCLNDLMILFETEKRHYFLLLVKLIYIYNNVIFWYLD